MKNFFKEKTTAVKNEPLCSRIPEDGTIEWAEYVQNNYSTEYFKPVDLFRAGMIVERKRWTDALHIFESNHSTVR